MKAIKWYFQMPECFLNCSSVVNGNPAGKHYCPPPCNNMFCLLLFHLDVLPSLCRLICVLELHEIEGRRPVYACLLYLLFRGQLLDNNKILPEFDEITSKLCFCATVTVVVESRERSRLRQLHRLRLVESSFIT